MEQVEAVGTAEAAGTTDPRPPILVAEDLTMSYRGWTALRGLSFSLLPGHVMGFLGPNGAGEDNGDRILTTILRPTSGRFAVDGISSDRPAEIRPRIGVLPRRSDCPTRSRGSNTSRTSPGSTDGEATTHTSTDWICSSWSDCENAGDP